MIENSHLYQIKSHSKAIKNIVVLVLFTTPGKNAFLEICVGPRNPPLLTSLAKTILYQH